jgi:hydroxypyruvate isomerase
MKLSACIEWLFADETDSIPQRVHLAAEAGLQGVEFHQWRNKPLDQVRQALDATGLAITSIIVEPRCSLVNESDHERFIGAVRESLPAARRLGCPNLVVASGFCESDRSIEKQRDDMTRILGVAAGMAADVGLTLVLEPLNIRVDHPGMYLNKTRMGMEIVEAVGSDGLKLLYDAYHSAVMGESAAEELAARMHLVRHVQVADLPGRGAPGTGNIDWKALLKVLSDGGYTGMLGMEFKLNDQSTREALATTRAALAGR